jgi:FKBP-type peptidyl-prolyl cis-trans isomerase (trigger factor)
VEISGELGVPEFTKYRGAAINHINEHAKIDGFRQGKVPEQVLVNHVGEEQILMEMAEIALQELYPRIMDEKKIDAIGRPEITITKLAKDNPLGFKIKTAVAPEVKLPAYAAIAKTENAKPVEVVAVEDKDVDQVLEELRHNRAHQENGGVHQENEKLPELNDEFAKMVGKFDTLDELKKQIKENLRKEKEYKAKDKKRLTIIEGVIAGSTIVLPPVLIESELDRMMAELQADIERVGLKFDDYLAHLKKTAAEMRESWRGEAEKRIKTSLILDKIAETEKLEPKNEEVETEAKHLMNHYPNVPPERIVLHVKSMMRNEEVWKFLEEQK